MQQYGELSLVPAESMEIQNWERRRPRCSMLRSLVTQGITFFSPTYMQHRADGKMLRVRMRGSSVGNRPGYSWVEVRETVHTFCARDFTHLESEGIRALLDELDLKMREDGYISATKSVMHDVEEEEKQHTLRYHSERLAVAYGIMEIPSGRPIRVFKNLRACVDCHAAIKHISRVTGRLIVLRDAKHFHHFEGGVCNCGDYW